MRAILISFLVTMLTLCVGAAPIGQFDGQSDVGGPKTPGACQYDSEKQAYTISGADTNMWFTRDQFHFVWKKMNGDFLLRMRVAFMGKGAVNHRKVGWMVRPDLEATSPYADCAEHGDGLTSLQYRMATGTNTEEIHLPITNADVLQFERKGDKYIFSAAKFGEPFVSAELPSLALGDDVYAGMFICSHDGEVTETAACSAVRVIKPVKEGFVPYRDFIGSSLELLEPETGELHVALESKEPFEAPDWTHDGSALIYNVSGRGAGWGRLRHFELSSGATQDIDTGFADRNNNDHVLSFDGNTLAISDQAASHGGQSAVFIVPTTGGTPRQLTPLSPSYAHGWSPDGKFVVYTGGRSNKFDIYKMASEGGEEIRLTDAPGLNDGPEYSPDGNYIYFNSSRTGRMQLWRMKPDGSSQEQLTHDEFNNWFPHISPDGMRIAFISFPGDISPTDHPYYKHCYLRLMPAAGGEARVIAYVYGGQGTMNVPSWSPDGKRLAFVSNNTFP